MSRFPFLVLSCALGTGCARNAEEQQLAEMREAMTHVDENPSFGEKLTAKELAEIVKQQRQPTTSGLEPKNVVRLEDGSEEQSAAPAETAGFEAADDPGVRPLIRVQGSPHAREIVEQTMPEETTALTHPVQTQPSALDPEARKAYDAALALVNNKQYGQALDAFAGFLLRYPDHPFAANAMYWRGESYFAQGDYMRAVEQFEGVVARFPLGGKTPDALLKLGICQQKLKNQQKAQTYFDKLTREWPRSDAARRIPTPQKTIHEEVLHLCRGVRPLALPGRYRARPRSRWRSWAGRRWWAGSTESDRHNDGSHLPRRGRTSSAGSSARWRQQHLLIVARHHG